MSGAVFTCVYEKAADAWHICKRPAGSDFQPIACHESEGINLPWPRQLREPTCPECVALAVRAERTVAGCEALGHQDRPALARSWLYVHCSFNGFGGWRREREAVQAQADLAGLYGAAGEGKR
jgi:hypothetical protein